MVFAVQCPEPRCRKFMLVEEHDRGTVVACLICKTPIRVGASSGQWSVDSGQTDPDRSGVNDHYSSPNRGHGVADH